MLDDNPKCVGEDLIIGGIVEPKQSVPFAID